MSKRVITIKSGEQEIQMEVTEEEYQNYYRGSAVHTKALHVK